MTARSGARFADALEITEFRSLWAAEAISVAGDQLARVALALLVYARTSSAVQTALTYALTFIPAILGGLLLAGLADRFPRRPVLIATDLARAALAGAMALPGMPLPVLWVLVAVLSAAAGPFKAAQGATLPVVLSDTDTYQAGIALRQVTAQIAQLAGFAGGGIAVAALGPLWCLVIDAGTFVVSAVLVRVGVRARPAPSPPADGGDDDPDPAGSGAAPGNRRAALAVVYALVGMIGLYVVAEGVAAPYGHGIGVAAIGVGWLMAADPIGSALGAWATTRSRIPATPAIMIGCAAAAGVPLVASAFRPGLVASMALWSVSGALSTIMLVQVTVLVKDLVPDHRRGRVSGRLATVLYASQGLAILAGGVAADAIGPALAVAAAGALAVVLAGFVALLWRIARPRQNARAEPERNTMDGRHRSLLRTTGTSSQRTPDPAAAGDPVGEPAGSGSVSNAGPAAEQKPTHYGR